MLREMEDPLQTSGWYVVAGECDVVLRVHPGMKLGEDSTGDLTVDPADAQVEFQISDDGSLILIACGDHELETEPGKRIRRADVSRRCRLHLHLIRNRLSIDTDFAGTSTPEESLEIRTIRPEPSGGGLILVPEAVNATSGHRAAMLQKASAHTRRRVARRWEAIIAVGWTIALMGVYATFQAWYPSANEARPPTEPEAVTEDGPMNAITVEPPNREPTTVQALTEVTALLEAEPPPNESSLRVALQLLEALSVAYPDDLQVQQTLEQLTERMDSAARAEHDIREASASPVELIAPPAALRKAIAQHPTSAAAVSAAPAVSAQENVVFTEPPAQSTARTEPSEQPPTSDDGGSIGAAAQSMAAVRATPRDDLESAAEAFERGFLIKPPESNAYALYSRVLASDPDSEAARRGIELIRERLITRARGHLESEDFDAALASLDDAATAGADGAPVDDLRAEVSYRQRLADARAGRFDRLHPIRDLTVIRQELPAYQPLCTRGWRSSWCPGYSATGVERSVDIEMTVSETGNVSDVEVLGDPPRRFARAARQAVSRWRFQPVLEHDRPMPVRTVVRMTFRDE